MEASLLAFRLLWQHTTPLQHTNKLSPHHLCKLVSGGYKGTRHRRRKGPEKKDLDDKIERNQKKTEIQRRRRLRVEKRRILCSPKAFREVLERKLQHMSFELREMATIYLLNTFSKSTTWKE